MLRPRVGHFVYSAFEKRVILADLVAFASISPPTRVNTTARLGIVFGALTVNGKVDTEFAAEVVGKARECGIQGLYFLNNF